MSQKEKIIGGYLAEAGIEIGGNKPWDIQVHNNRLYKRILSGGTIASGESYMDGWWDADQLDLFFEKILKARLEHQLSKSVQVNWLMAKNKLFNFQNARRSYRVGKQHYDRGMDLFSRMLDKRLIYSCGYWKNATTLDQAQEDKLDLICRKLQLEPGMTLLDIGCGWGGLLKYAVENYDVKGTGITVSGSQACYARKSCAGLPVSIRLTDYRNLTGKFDRIVSVGMAEHVGAKNYSVFMKTARQCLKDDGLFLLHTIGSNRSVNFTDPWIEKYIFPNSMLPSLSQLTRAAEPFFRLEDFHSFGPYYDRTLMAWDENFRKSWHEIATRYDDTFYRMWRYYLMSSAASFRVRRIQLWQFLLAGHSRLETAETIR